MKKLIAVVFLFFAFAASAQQGVIKGKLTDATTGEEIIGANVVIQGTATGASSSITGDYEFSADPGSYTIQTSYIGYKPFMKQGVVIKAGETTVLNIAIAEDVESLTEVVVEARADNSSENILMMQRKGAALAVESIGARELSARGVSDVKAGLVKMAGVSQASSSKGVYVRGLGDRYNNAYLNGLPLPSPNPNLKVIELDLFPTAVLRNIDVSKTYNVNQFGDMSGASVNILTKDAAEEDYVQIGLGLNYNTQASFKSFLINRDGAAGYFGFAASQRQSPVNLKTQQQYFFEEATQDPFTTGFNPKQISAPLDNSYNLQLGKHFEFGASKLGVIVSGAFNNNYRQDEGVNDILDGSQNAIRDFNRTRYRYETNLTGLVGVQYSLQSKHYVNLNYLFINNSANNYIASQGNTFEEQNANEIDLRRLRSRYLETNLQDLQLISSHAFGKLDLRWGGSYAMAYTDEPDRLDLSFSTEEGNTQEGQFSALNTDQNQRYFQLTDENEINGFVEASYGIGSEGANAAKERHKLVLGYQFKNKAREEALRSFRLQTTGNFATGVVQFNRLDDLFTDQAYTAGNFSYSDANADGSNQASAERLIQAGYAYTNLRMGSRFTIIPGIRAEYTEQTVSFKRLGDGFVSSYREAVVNQLDLLPALNIKYDLTNQKVVRAAISKTLTRPNFRELVPVPFVDENLRSFAGNPYLINSDVYNADLKVDVYPQPGELLSVGAFYKYIDNPIEQLQDGVNYIRPFNIPSATAFGVELEASKRLSNIFSAESAILEGLVLDGNLTLMHTNIVADDAAIAADETIFERDKPIIKNLTAESRSLQGASPYLVNLSLGYDNLLFAGSEESSIRLTYNHFGRRIFAAGTNNLGDIYEVPYGTLDFVIQNTWKNGLGVKLSAKNLLNPSIRLEQVAGPVATTGDALIQSYQVGMNFGLSLSYRLGLEK